VTVTTAAINAGAIDFDVTTTTTNTICLGSVSPLSGEATAPSGGASGNYL
jgi:hypothetical protein